MKTEYENGDKVIITNQTLKTCGYKGVITQRLSNYLYRIDFTGMGLVTSGRFHVDNFKLIQSAAALRPAKPTIPYSVMTIYSNPLSDAVKTLRFWEMDWNSSGHQITTVFATDITAALKLLDDECEGFDPDATFILKTPDGEIHQIKRTHSITRIMIPHPL